MASGSAPTTTAERTSVDTRDARIDRTIVLLATVTASLFYVLLAVTWLIGGERQFLIQSLAPVTVAGTGVVMLRANKPRPIVQIVIGAVGLVLYVSLAEATTPGDPVIGLLVMAIAGVVLIRRGTLVFSTAAAITLLLTGFFWQPASEPAGERAVLAFSVVVAFVFTATLVHYLKQQSLADRTRLRELIDSKDEFVATVSHELRTPLTAVVGLAHELHVRHGDFSPEELDEFTALLVSESSDIADIVEDLLVAARADLGSLTLDLQVIDIAEVVRSTLTELVGADVDAIPEAPLMVEADPLRLRQIVRNLIGNAVRYGGDRVRVLATSDAEHVAVEVRDDGPPLPEHDRVRIFEAYHHAAAIDGKPGSVGLGLTVSRQLARLMGGDVVYDHDGREAVFALRLPLARRDGAASHEDAA